MLKIKGNSGSNLEIIEKDGKIFVKKILEGSTAHRLYQQAKKQQQFSSINNDDYDVPKVDEISLNNNSVSFTMDYYNSKIFVDFFQSSSKNDIDKIINHLTNFIHYCNINSQTENKLDSFLEKYEKLKQKGVLYRANDIDKIFNRLNVMILPVGMCHGDLTFSNILFDDHNDKLILIDFLDTFCESPIQDMVKLRQDTKFYWSFNKYEHDFDIVRMKTIFDYIDNKLHDAFLKYPYYKNYYIYFQIMNFLRILPYSKEEKITSYLYSVLDKLIEEAK